MRWKLLSMFFSCSHLRVSCSQQSRTHSYSTFKRKWFYFTSYSGSRLHSKSCLSLSTEFSLELNCLYLYGELYSFLILPIKILWHIYWFKWKWNHDHIYLSYTGDLSSVKVYHFIPGCAHMSFGLSEVLWTLLLARSSLHKKEDFSNWNQPAS